MRVKVRVEDLLKRVHAAKAKAVKEHEKEVAKWEALNEAWPGIVADALSDARIAAENGTEFDTTESYRRDRYVKFLAVPLPAKAKAPGTKPKLDTSRFDKDASLLEMCSDEVLSISTDDRFSRYL